MVVGSVVGIVVVGRFAFGSAGEMTRSRSGASCGGAPAGADAAAAVCRGASDGSASIGPVAERCALGLRFVRETEPEPEPGPGPDGGGGRVGGRGVVAGSCAWGVVSGG